MELTSELVEQLICEVLERRRALWAKVDQLYFEALDELLYDATAPRDWESEGGASPPQHDA